MCHIINSHLSVCSAGSCHRLVLCLHHQWMWIGVQFLPMLNAFVNIFENLDPFRDNPLRHDTVPIVQWHHSIHFGTCYTFRLQKWITALCYSLVQMKLDFHVYGTNLMTGMDYQGHTCTTMVGEECSVCILSCPTSSIANFKTCTYIADNFWLTYVIKKKKHTFVQKRLTQYLVVSSDIEKKFGRAR
jgi:hypothetical protein